MTIFCRALLFVLLLQHGSSICQSAVPSDRYVCESNPTASLYFVGRIVELTPVGGNGDVLRATLRVNEQLAGMPQDSETMLIFRHLETCDTVQAIKTDADYLVKTTREKDGRVDQIEHCDQLTALSRAQDELQYLRQAQSGKTPTQVVGQVREGYHGKHQPIQETRVVLEGVKQRFEFKSDENGRFTGDILPGVYKVVTNVPKGYAVSEYYRSPTSVIAVEHRCLQISLFAEPTATIVGKIGDENGVPLDPLSSSVQLSLVTAEKNEFVQSLWPDENSEFHADHLRPGRYLLGLNTYLPPVPGSAPYRPTFYPGVTKRSEAEEIVIEPGEQKRLQEMRIKQGAVCNIPVLVTDAFGHSVGDAGLGIAYPEYDNFHSWGVQSDQKGHAEVFAIEPGTVYVRAEVHRPDGSAIFSNVAELQQCPRQPVLLQLTREVQAPATK